MTKEQEESIKKICFIVTPIGSNDSLTRKRVDQWETLIYKPTFGEEFNIIRADRIATPGFIIKQILELLVNADLVIIDYTEMNPNVMYEAAVRHLAKEPFIQICPEDQRLPFDVHNLRVIPYDPNNLEYPTILSKKLKEAYEEIKKPDYKIPEVLPLEFDFKNIVSDPEKFVEILKKHLVYSPGTGLATYRENISEVYESTLSDFSVRSKYYKCNICDTEFDPK